MHTISHATFLQSSQLGKSCLGAVHGVQWLVMNEEKFYALRDYRVMHKKLVIRQMQIFRKTRSLPLTVMRREILQLIYDEIFIKNRKD